MVTWLLQPYLLFSILDQGGLPNQPFWGGLSFTSNHQNAWPPLPVMLLGDPVPLLPNLFVLDVLMVKYLREPTSRRKATQWRHRRVEETCRSQGGEHHQEKDPRKSKMETKGDWWAASKLERTGSAPWGGHACTEQAAGKIWGYTRSKSCRRHWGHTYLWSNLYQIKEYLCFDILPIPSDDTGILMVMSCHNRMSMFNLLLSISNMLRH